MRENAGKDDTKRMKQENICGRKKKKKYHLCLEGDYDPEK